MGRCGWIHTHSSFYKRHLSICGSGHPLVLLRPVSAACLPGGHFCILVRNYYNWQLQILLGSKDVAQFSVQHRTAFRAQVSTSTSSPSSVLWYTSQTVPRKHCFSLVILLLNTSLSSSQCQGCNSLAPKGLITL